MLRVNELLRRSCQALCAITVLVALCGVKSVVAQQVVAKEDVNVRADPSRSHKPIAMLTSGDTASLVSSDTTSGYLHVRTSGGVNGWAYSRYVEVTGVALTTFSGTTTLSPGGIDAPQSYNHCALTGNPSPTGSQYASLKVLNKKKNRFTPPEDADIDSAMTLESLLAPGNDVERFDDTKGAVFEGWVDSVKVGGIETVNCGTRDAAHRDSHIEISLNMGDPENKRVIVEVTPRWRSAESDHGEDWSTQALQASLIGKHVRFRGWLLYDKEHEGQAENTAPGNASNWRATVWEIHPVTSFEIIPSP